MKIDNKLIKHTATGLVALVFCFCANVYAATTEKIIIITYKDNPRNEISALELERMFLGKMRSWPEGNLVKSCDLIEANKNEQKMARAIFSKKFLGKDLITLKNYWIKMVFSGKGRPPVAFKSVRELIRFVADHPGSIGYIDPINLTEEVKTLEVIWTTD